MCYDNYPFLLLQLDRKSEVESILNLQLSLSRNPGYGKDKEGDQGAKLINKELSFPLDPPSLKPQTQASEELEETAEKEIQLPEANASDEATGLTTSDLSSLTPTME